MSSPTEQEVTRGVREMYCDIRHWHGGHKNVSILKTTVSRKGFCDGDILNVSSPTKHEMTREIRDKYDNGGMRI